MRSVGGKEEAARAAAFVGDPSLCDAAIAQTPAVPNVKLELDAQLSGLTT